MYTSTLSLTEFKPLSSIETALEELFQLSSPALNCSACSSTVVHLVCTTDNYELLKIQHSVIFNLQHTAVKIKCAVGVDIDIHATCTYGLGHTHHPHPGESSPRDSALVKSHC
jgi:hypothetical protein